MIRLLDIKVRWLKSNELEDLGIEVESNSFWKEVLINPEKIAWISPYEYKGVLLSTFHFTGIDSDILQTNIKYESVKDFLNNQKIV